jgi:hypothetical protein
LYAANLFFAQCRLLPFQRKKHFASAGAAPGLGASMPSLYSGSGVRIVRLPQFLPSIEQAKKTG